jgi:hypothetical protein
VHTSVPAELKELLWQEILLACNSEEGVVVVVVPLELVVLPPEVVALELPPEVCPEDPGVNWIP